MSSGYGVEHPVVQLAGFAGMDNQSTFLRVRILVFEDLPGIWTARALEHDLLAEGRTIDSAVHALLRIIRAHIDYDRRHNRDPLSSFRAAPQTYWNAFTRATPLGWASRLAGALPIGAQVVAAVAMERPRAAKAEQTFARQGFHRPAAPAYRAAHM
jgi:hypothetical protein